jgi:hypothetical protein
MLFGMSFLNMHQTSTNPLESRVALKTIFNHPRFEILGAP